MKPLIDIERVCDEKWTEGNIIHGTKRTQNKIKIAQWRLPVQLGETVLKQDAHFLDKKL